MPICARDMCGARSAIFGLLGDLGRAFVRHGDQPRPFADLAALVRGLIEEHTFNPRVGPGIVQLVDAMAAPYGRYQDATLVGLTETDWPEPSARSIFYPGRLLRELGWPADADRRTAARAAFDDLLQLPLRTIALSTILLEDDAMVRPSAFLEDLERASPATSVDAARRHQPCQPGTAARGCGARADAPGVGPHS